MEYSLKLSPFLFSRIENTAANKEYVKSVEVSYDYLESFGNEFIRVYYIVTMNDAYYTLHEDVQNVLIESFAGSSYCVYTISKYSDNATHDQQILKLQAFKQVYLSLTSYAALHLEKYLDNSSAIIIQGIDFWPYANYAENFLEKITKKYQYEAIMHSSFQSDVFQYNKLHQLALISEFEYKKEKEHFNITEDDLILFMQSLSEIRYILIAHQVPIHTIGTKTIDNIHIHSSKYIQALKEEIRETNSDEHYNSSHYIKQKTSRYKETIEYIYDIFLVNEKNETIKQQMISFIDRLPIQRGDILLLKDNRIVIIESLFFEGDEIKLKYHILKNNLQKSVRSRTVELSEASFYIKEALFQLHLKEIPEKRLSLYLRWMQKRGIKLTIPSFK